MKLHTVLLTAAASIALAACNPAPSEPAPETPPPAPIAEPTAPSGPAAENTSDSLSTTPPTDVAATPPAATPAPPATPAAPPAAAAGPTKEELANGAAVYARTCAMCHGPNGAGTAMGVALTAGHEYAAIKEKITKGPMNTGDKMPPLGGALSADDLDDVSKFVENGF